MAATELAFTRRGYQGADDLAAMQQALAGWIRDSGGCGYEHVGDLPHRIYNGLRGRYPRHEVIRLWYSGADLVGFALVYPRHGLYDVRISPAHRANSLEREVLNWATTNLRTWRDTANVAEAVLSLANL